jgi:hypothetical protein
MGCPVTAQHKVDLMSIHGHNQILSKAAMHALACLREVSGVPIGTDMGLSH